MTPTTPASASVQSEQTRRPWAVFDSQGFYKLERSEVEARAFCDTYNARNPNDPLRPYTCCALDDVRPPQQPSATGGDGWNQHWGAARLAVRKVIEDHRGFELDALMESQFIKEINAAFEVLWHGLKASNAPQPTSGVPGIVPTLLSALNGMLTFFGMDEDENSKAVFDRARKAEAMAQDWVEQPYTTIDMGHGKWEVGAGTNADLPCIAFGKNGSGKVGELITPEPRQMSAEETFAVITFANAEGLAVLEEKVSEVRELFFPGAAPQPAAARVGLSPEQIAQLWAFGWTGDRVKFVRAIEAAHGIASPQEDGGTAA